MPARSGVGLACKLVVDSAGQTTTVFDLHRVVDVFDHYILKDKIDCCSS